MLLCQRPTEMDGTLLWEFASGKVRPGETKQQALIRACRQKLSITIALEDVLLAIAHIHSDSAIHLMLFHAAIVEGALQRLWHNDLQWLTADEPERYIFYLFRCKNIFPFAQR